MSRPATQTTVATLPSAALPGELSVALRNVFRHPVKTLVPPWSWKAAVCSAIIRGATFFLTNLQSGHRAAIDAMTIEVVFAIFAAGLLGALSQQLRLCKPLWATFLLVCLGMPGAMVVAQLILHRLAHTPHVGPGLLASFLLAAIANSFSWYAMRHGAMLGGRDSTTFAHDMRALPGIALSYVTFLPAHLYRLARGR